MENITYSWFKHFTYCQEIGQFFWDYLTKIRKLSSDSTETRRPPRTTLEGYAYNWFEWEKITRMLTERI